MPGSSVPPLPEERIEQLSIEYLHVLLSGLSLGSLCCAGTSLPPPLLVRQSDEKRLLFCCLAPYFNIIQCAAYKTRGNGFTPKEGSKS